MRMTGEQIVFSISVVSGTTVALAMIIWFIFEGMDKRDHALELEKIYADNCMKINGTKGDGSVYVQREYCAGESSK